jgi:hypothetical protein
MEVNEECQVLIKFCLPLGENKYTIYSQLVYVRWQQICLGCARHVLESSEPGTWKIEVL